MPIDYYRMKAVPSLQDLYNWGYIFGEEEKVMTGDPVKREPQTGDKYDIPVEVIGVGHPANPKRYKVRVRGSGSGRLEDWICGATLDASKLVEAAPKPIGIGDRVTWGVGDLSYMIRDITEDGWAFLIMPQYVRGGDKVPGCYPTVERVSDLRRID